MLLYSFPCFRCRGDSVIGGPLPVSPPSFVWAGALRDCLGVLVLLHSVPGYGLLGRFFHCPPLSGVAPICEGPQVSAMGSLLVPLAMFLVCCPLRCFSLSGPSLSGPSLSGPSLSSPSLSGLVSNCLESWWFSRGAFCYACVCRCFGSVGLGTTIGADGGALLWSGRQSPWLRLVTS